ncbi:MAG TPA: PAS domain S-box protein [Verrucomicrobiae bacterium]|nr:PAS domain S-box protein [Verrucomicrobiae bacterium]
MHSSDAKTDWNERTSASFPAPPDNQSMFRLMFERSTDAFTLVDPQSGRFVDVNSASIRIAGAPSKAAMLELGPGTISPEFQPDGTRSIEKAKEMVGLALEKGSHRFDWVINRFDGSSVPVEIVLTPIPIGERPLLLSAAREITERKRAEAALRASEERWRMVFEQAPFSVQIFAPDGWTRRVNPGWEKLFGMTREQAAQFNLLTDPQLSGSEAAPLIRRAFSGEVVHVPAVPFELPTPPSGGPRTRWIGATLFPIRDELGQLLEVVCVHEDITERKQAEESIRQWNVMLEQRIAERTSELAQSEAQMRTLVEHAPEAIVVFDGASGDFLNCNENAARLLGLNREELLKLHPADVSPEFQPNGRRSADLSREYIERALAGEVPVFEWIHRGTHGRLIPCEVRLVRLPAEGRRLVRGSITDTTERKRAEQALRDSEQKHRALFEATSQGVMIHDAQKFHDVNPAAVRIMGYNSAAEIIGKHPADLSPARQPNGEDSLVAASRHISECMEKGTARFEWVSLTSGGQPVPVDVILTRIEMGGKPLIQAVINDISERKAAEEALRKSEEKFKQLYELSPLGMAQVEWDGTFVQVNKAFENIIGYSQAELQKLSYWEVTPREYEEAELAVLDSLRRTGRFGPHEKEYFHKDGHRVPVVLNGMAATSPDGRTQLWSIVEDITQRKNSEAELHKVVAREKELGQLKSNFVSMVSHEFRTPLGIIMSSAEILADYLDRLDPDERRSHLDSVSRNARRMGDMMEEVLVLSRLDAGRMDFSPETIDLRKFFVRLVDEALSSTDRRCPIVLNLAETSETALLDESLARHILTNLISNATKYSEPGQPVRLDVFAEGQDLICVIRDHGIGIPPADQECLFNAFHRGDNVGQRPGTGLGLVIVKRCVELHGGTIRLWSKVGEGTEVTVRLPVFRATALPRRGDTEVIRRPQP